MLRRRRPSDAESPGVRCIRPLLAALAAAAALLILSSCAVDGPEGAGKNLSSLSAELRYDHGLDLDYATEFEAGYYEDGYVSISVSDGSTYLLVPEEADVPGDLDEEVVTIRIPVKRAYLAASAAMDMFASIDAMDALSFSSLKEDSWYIDEAREAMADGSLVYAGKYSSPDYELIQAGSCDLAIENTMIFHAPEIKQQLETLGIPVLVDYSSYENTPQGRMEWVKLYGLLTGREAEAKAVFDEQVSAIEAVKAAGQAGQKDASGSVAFFYITSAGGVNVRKSSDYLAKMIALAGGEYVFSDLGEEDDTASSTMTMQMEEFYAKARDADYLVYNSSIEGELESLDDFLQESPLLAKFEAVKRGHVYCTTRNLYQASMELGTMISDFYHMMNGEDGKLIYLYKLK